MEKIENEDFRKIFMYDSTSILSTLTSARSSKRFPAVTRLTVHRRRQCVCARSLDELRELMYL
eukprot:1703193-Pyramimonas_sp.AAC.1